jgi:hypothetical protein
MKKHKFEIFADYHMIFIQDELVAREHDDLHWSDEDIKAMLYEIKYGFIIGTARNMTVPLTVTIHESEPVVNQHEWDQIVACSFDLPSGILSISGTSDYIGDHRKIELKQGTYNALICYAGLSTISEDGLEGNDSYLLNIWPSDTPQPMKVIKLNLAQTSQ